MKNEADTRLEGENLATASAKSLRTGWFEGYKPEADSELRHLRTREAKSGFGRKW